MSARVWFLGTCIELAADGIETSNDSGPEAIACLIGQLEYLKSDLQPEIYNRLEITLQTRRGPVVYKAYRCYQTCLRLRDEIILETVSFSDEEVRKSSSGILRQIAAQLL